MRKDDYLSHEIAKAVDGNGREVWQPRFIKLDTAFRREMLAKLKGCKLSVYLDLAEHMNREGECWPSMETLVKETRYSRRQIIRAIKELEAMGIISVERGRPAHGRKPVNRYRVNSYVRYCDKGWREESAPELSTGPERVENVTMENVGNVTMDGDISSIKGMSEMSLEEDFEFKKTLSEEDSPPKNTEGAALRGAKKQTRAARASLPPSDDEVSLAIAEAIKGGPESVRRDIAARVRSLLPGKTDKEIASEVRRRFGPGGRWYTADWRGRKGEPPTDAQIFREWQRMEPNASSASQDDTGDRQRYAYYQVAEIHGGA